MIDPIFFFDHLIPIGREWTSYYILIWPFFFQNVSHSHKLTEANPGIMYCADDRQRPQEHSVNQHSITSFFQTHVNISSFSQFNKFREQFGPVVKEEFLLKYYLLQYVFVLINNYQLFQE